MSEFEYARVYECNENNGGCGIQFKVIHAMGYDKRYDVVTVAGPFCPNCGEDTATGELGDDG